MLKKYVLWLTVCIIFLVILEILTPNIAEVKVSNPVVLNSRRFADMQNSSYLPVTGSLKGEIIWEQKSPFIESIPPIHLAISGPLLIISYPSFINIRNRETGQSVWVRQLSGNILFDLKAEGLVTTTHAGYYELINFNQEVIQRMLLPFLTSDTVLFLSHRKGNEMYYIYQSMPTPVSGPDDIYERASFTYSRYNTGEQSFIWRFRRHEDIIDALLSGEQDRFCICTTSNAYLFSSTNDSDKGLKTILFEQILSCAYDFQGNLLVVGKQDKEKEIYLKKFDNSNGLIWQVPLGITVLSKQPPATLPDGTVYLLSGGRLYNIKDGNIAWTYQIPAKPGEALFTLLKDGSVLLSSGVYLVQISNTGKEVKRIIIVDDPITCRPIMDEEGRIYIGTVKGIRSIR